MPAAKQTSIAPIWMSCTSYCPADNARYGALQLAFNNVGIAGPLGPIAEIDISAYQQLMNVNLHSVFYGMHYQIPAMLKAGGGAIVNNWSILGLVGDANAAPYVAAKHGIVGLT